MLSAFRTSISIRPGEVEIVSSLNSSMICFIPLFSSIEFEVPIVASKLRIEMGSILSFLKLSIDITLSLFDSLSPVDAFKRA